MIGAKNVNRLPVGGALSGSDEANDPSNKNSNITKVIQESGEMDTDNME